MTNVIFVAPLLSENASRSIAALLNLEHVGLGLISMEPQEKLAPELRNRLAAHWRLDDILDRQALEHAVKQLAEQMGGVDRLIAAFEQLQVPLAEIRERLGIQGMGTQTAINFRDKARMKDVLAEAGLPCARYQRAATEQQAWAFAESNGYPLVVKPLAGAGAQATFRVNDAEQMAKALEINAPQPDHPVLIEEHIQGNEHSMESVTVDGRTVWQSLTHYYPTPLEVVRNRWIQWCIVLPREIDDPRYDDIKDAASRALSALGMDTGLTHMEWFRRRDGSIAISEVAARPPGAQIMTLTSYAHEFDLDAAWARLMVFGEFDPPQRKWAVGAAFLRGQGDGRVRAIHGLDEAHVELGALVVEAKLPVVGQMPTGSYEGEGFVIVRHQETAVVENALSRIISLVRVEMG